MASLRSCFARSRLAVIAAAALAAAVPAVAVAGPAQASLSGTSWVQQTLPAGYVAGPGPIGTVVSCVRGTKFCVVITEDTAVSGPGSGAQPGQAALVTTNGGASWTGFTGSWASFIDVTSISCVSTSVCWAAGIGQGSAGEVIESTNGGQTWTEKSPAFLADSGGTRTPNAIDCVSVTTCWLAGVSQATSQGPEVDETTDGGATWTAFSNLPAIAKYDPDGTYTLNGISCTSALACVLVGGLNYPDGKAQVIATTDGGATWSLSPDATLAGLQQLDSVSCLPVSGALPTCHAAGDTAAASGAAEITSTDGGVTWHGVRTDDTSGGLDSISCPDVQHCWAAGVGTEQALLGTGDGGSSWTAVTSDTSNEAGQVSCATASFCVAVTDNGLWVTTSGGGLVARGQPVTTALPRLSAPTVYARTGTNATITGAYDSTGTPGTATVTVTSPAGQQTSSTVPIGPNNFYSDTVSDVPAGTTTVTFTAGSLAPVTDKVVGHTGQAPSVSALSAHAGPASGGSTLTISGTNFTAVSRVYVGTSKASTVTRLSATQLRVHTPAGTGAGFVRVFTRNGGESALTGQAVYNFLPVPAVSKLSPASGRAAGGTTVTITGTGFGYVTAVYFGTRKGTHLRVLSADQITVVSPAGSGTVNVRVHTPGGVSPVTTKDRYRY
jgi:large repetitive protein